MKPIVLDAITKKMQLILSAAPATTQPDWVASYADANGAIFTEGSSGGVANGATAVDIVAAPASGYRRIVSEVTIYNADTATVTATLRYNDNGTIRVIAKIEIGAGNTWSMSAGFTNTSVLSKVVQTVNYSTGAVAVSAAAMTYLDAVPQITEGSQYMEVSITPKNAANKLLVEVIANFASSAQSYQTGAIFRDSTVNAIAANMITIPATSFTQELVMRSEIVAGSTSPTTFKLRAGCSAGNTTFNGLNGVRLFGGVCSSSIRVTEYLP